MMRLCALLFIIFLLGTGFRTSEQAPHRKQHTLSGNVKDKATGEDLAGVVVYNPTTGKGVVSNTYGFYSFTLPDGEHEVVFSFLGYETRREKINLKTHKTLDLSLREASQELESVVVVRERPNANVMATEMSVAKLSPQQIKTIPALMGEADILKAIQLLPGVQSTSEGSSGFNVRGGNYDQNLILLDEATIYNASHLMGFFSVFNNDAVREVKLYKGDIPAAYGGRLSSLLNVHTRDGNSQRFGGTGGLGLIASRLTLEGPIVRDQASFIASGRRTYLEVFTPFVERMRENNTRASFYDLNAKINWRIDGRNRIYASYYMGEDTYGMTDARFEYGNHALTLRWNHVFGPKLFSNFSLAWSGYNYAINSNFTDQLAEKMVSKIDNYTAKADFSYQISPANHLRFGYHFSYHVLQPGSFVGVGERSVLNDIHLAHQFGIEQSAYVSNEQKIAEHLVLKYGLRATAFHNLGNARRSDYLENYEVVRQQWHPRGEIYNTQFSLEPRLGLLFAFNERHSVKLSYTRTAQFIQMASNSSSGSPTDYWFMASQNVKPQLSDQFAVGYFRNFRNNEYEFSVEVYYRDLKNAVDFKDHAQLLLNESFEHELRFGRGFSYGFEVMLARNGGRLNGWISYAFTRSMKRIDQINGERWYRAQSDKPVNVSVVANYQLSPRWKVSANWVYASGMPVTYPTGRMWIENNYVPLYSGRNEYRYPTYHRLDLSATWDLSRPGRRFRSDLNFSVYNAYGRKNPWTIYFKQEEHDPNIMYGKMTYLFTYVPSVTWNFTF